MKKIFICLTVLSMALGIYAEECPVYMLKLYENAPAESNGYEPKDEYTLSNGCVYKISVPRMDIYLPRNIRKPLGMVLVIPGGGYEYVTAYGEGSQVADYLVPRGYAVAVLKYRMPNGHQNVPLADALQAMRILRARQAAWQMPDAPIGVMGFSAGGHLAASLLTHYADELTRPDYGILFYPVISMDASLTHMGSRNNLLGDSPTDEQVTYWSCHQQVTANTPPCLILASQDDAVVPVENSSLFHQALQTNNVPSQILIVSTGGHGWGITGQVAERERVNETMLSFLKAQNTQNTQNTH